MDESMNEVIKKIGELPAHWVWLGLTTPAVLGWGAKSLFSSSGRRELEERARLADERVKHFEVRAINAETDLDKLKVKLELAQEQNSAFVRETSELRTRQAELLAGGGNDRQQAEIIAGLRSRIEKFEQLRNSLLGSEDDLWKLRAPVQPDNFAARMRDSRVRVVTVANLKGGVGKTTVVANLAAYFAKARGKRVLLMDFDYQGSLTRMMVLGAKIALGNAILSDSVLGGEIDGKWLANSARELGSVLPGTRLVTCGATFEGYENRLLLRWLMGQTSDDSRYRLASLILSPAIQEAFDLVLIDAPPRLSMGTVNALCASHAILVPTVPDALSVDAVGRFLQRANVFRELNPALHKAAVVACLTIQGGLVAHEQDAMRLAEASLQLWHGQGKILSTNVRHFTSLGKAAGREIGYLEDKAVRETFLRLGEEVAQQWQV